MSQAILTDEQDASYDLSWLRELPSDDDAAVIGLRDVLAADPNPLARHYLYCELESRLYRMAQANPSGLAEYDRICRAHDAEMDNIRPALIRKFSVVPLLETYRQAAIRFQKAARWEDAARWANRGLEVYGAEAARQDAVEDLQARVSKYEGKMRPPATPKRPRIVSSAPRSKRPTHEALICESCGVEFIREVTRGRKPRFCPSCRT